MDNVKKNLKWYLLGVLVLAVLFIWGIVLAEGKEGVLTVAFLNVGQGDSIYIEAPNGNQVLIDGGPDKKVLRALGEIMPFYDRSIDVIVATHPDKDHIGGLPIVLENYAVEVIIESGVGSKTNTYRELQNIIENQGLTRILGRRDVIIILDEKRGVYLRVLFPDQDVSDWDANEASVITRLVYGENSFLFPVDTPQSIENYLTYLERNSSDGGLKSDVLKVGHHGSKPSTSPFFIAKVRPAYAIISAGENNRYGHPNQEVLDVLKNYQANILTTYEEGTIIFQSDGETITLKK